MKNMAWRNNVIEEGDRHELIKYLIEAWADVDRLQDIKDRAQDRLVRWLSKTNK